MTDGMRACLTGVGIVAGIVVAIILIMPWVLLLMAKYMDWIERVVG